MSWVGRVSCLRLLSFWVTFYSKWVRTRVAINVVYARTEKHALLLSFCQYELLHSTRLHIKNRLKDRSSNIIMLLCKQKCWQCSPKFLGRYSFDSIIHSLINSVTNLIKSINNCSMIIIKSTSYPIYIRKNFL